MGLGPWDDGILGASHRDEKRIICISLTGKFDNAMHITLRQLQVFLAVARTQSTTQGAKELALSQSAVSSALQELETQLDAKLFERAGKRLILNENSRMLYPYALALLEQGKEIERLFLGGRCTLNLGASSTIGNYLLPALLTRYQQHNPKVQLTLQVANTRDIIQAVSNFDVDIGFIEGPCQQADLEACPWLQDELVLFARAGHPLAGKRLSLSQLAEAQWILRESGSGTREVIEHQLLPQLGQLDVMLELGDSEAIKQAVRHSDGISCLSRRVVEETIAAGLLTELHTALPPLQRTLYLVRHKQKHTSTGLERFLQACQEELGSEPPFPQG